ncbi:MAG TPA: S1/P1 nuclease [Flavitalea sp.]|nr:S1/P1 nuclease [Flavitalea sp.]
MRLRNFKTVFLLFLCFYAPVQSMAWGVLGHRIVGEIADSYLTAKTKAEIKKILGNESIAIASNWADFIKSDTSYKYLSTWHYVNFEKGLSYEEVKLVLKNDTTVNAYTKMNFLISELKKKNLSQDKKIMYLRLLIHIVGDIHQPLHVSPVGSTGGNDIKLTWFTTPSNLHRVWDEHLVEFQQLSYTEYVKDINHTTLAQRKAWQMEPVTRWYYDSYVLAQQLHTGLGENPKLGYRYHFDYIKTVNEQLLKGGVHLAGILNGLFGK